MVVAGEAVLPHSSATLKMQCKILCDMLYVRQTTILHPTHRFLELHGDVSAFLPQAISPLLIELPFFLSSSTIL